MRLSLWTITALLLVAATGCTAIRAPLGLDALFGEEESQDDMLRKMANAQDSPSETKPTEKLPGAKLPAAKPADDPALAKILADIDQMTHLSAEAREQVKQDITLAKPSDRPYLAAVVRRATLPPGEEGKVRTVSTDSPAEPPSHSAPQSLAEPAVLFPAKEHARRVEFAPPNSAVPPASDLREQPAANPPQASRTRPPVRAAEPPQIEALPQVELPGPAEPLAREMIGALPQPMGYYPRTMTPHGPPGIQVDYAQTLYPAHQYPGQQYPGQPLYPSQQYPGLVQPAAYAAGAPPVPAIAKAWRAHLRDAITQLERDLKTADRPLPPNGEIAQVAANVPDDRGEREVLLRLLKLAAGEREEAVRRGGKLPTGEQEFWTHQMHTLATLLDPEGAPVPSRRAAVALRALRDAEAELAATSSLEIRNLAFCSEVRAFGSYAKFPVADFDPGQEVLLYAEIDNFRSEESKGGYKTALQGSYHLLDATGRSVAEHSFPVDEDHCASRRRDFFVPFRLYLPKLSPGEYTLQLTVEDQLAKKFGQGTIALRIKGRR